MKCASWQNISKHSNRSRLCHLCVGKVPGGWCTPTDPYIGFEGAFRCLMEAGEVAFLKHTTVTEMVESKSFKGVSTDQFQLLCKNGQRMPVSEYLQCNWGLVPSNAIVTSSARTIEQRKQYQRFLETAMRMYSQKTSSNSSFSSNLNGNNNNNNNRFQTDRFGNPNDRFNNQNDRFNNDRSSNNRNPFDMSSTTEVPFNDTQFIESFELFDSKRYGSRLNLMFQVNKQRISSSLA